MSSSTPVSRPLDAVRLAELEAAAAHHPTGGWRFVRELIAAVRQRDQLAAERLAIITELELDNARLRELVRGLAVRCNDQSELLTRRAERDTSK